MKKDRKTTLFIVCTIAIALLSALMILPHLGLNRDIPLDEKMSQEKKGEVGKNSPSVRPFVKVSLQPLGDYTQKEAECLQMDLEKHLSGMVNIDITFEVSPQKSLADTWKNDAKSRYRADKIIKAMEKNADKQHVIIALTHKDISVSYKGKKDWGVLGLSLIPKKVCVVSTYRLKNKKDLWKVTTHEFIHTYFEYHHCPNHNPSCIMKDAKGHADFSNKENLCDICRKDIHK